MYRACSASSVPGLAARMALNWKCTWKSGTPNMPSFTQMSVNSCTLRTYEVRFRRLLRGSEGARGTQIGSTRGGVFHSKAKVRQLVFSLEV